MAEVPVDKPNEAQALAIESGASPLVAYAGAGSGKTRVLVGRYLRHVLKEGVPPGRILAATFTEKAAAEMKERVSERLSEAEREDLVAQLNAAPICTLHSFCSRLIAPLALDLGIDPGYRILEQHEARLIQEECFSQVLTSWRLDHQEQLRLLVDRLHWSRDFGLRRGRTPASRGFAKEFLNLVEAVRCAGEKTDAPFASLNVDIEKNRFLVRELLSQLDALLAVPKNLTEKSREKAQAAVNKLRQYIELDDADKADIHEIATDLSKINLQVSEPLKPVLRQVKENLPPLLMDEVYREDYESVNTILNLLYADFSSEYRKAKYEAGVLDFLDLEEIALHALDQSLVPRPVIDQILIDESQDLNPVQWKIIKSLGEAAPVFAVGDGQQSIYGFRHADVGSFTRFMREAEERGGKTIPLSDNYRSRKSVLDAANCLFGSLWEKESDIPFLKLNGAYDYPEPLADEDDYQVELLIARGETRQKAREAEALFLAQRIYRLVRGGSFKVHRRESNAADDPQWSDVRVLVRSSSSFEYIEKAFNELGIPCIIAAGRGFWDALEIADIMALLRALEDPGDSLSMACLLKSPVVGFSDDDLLGFRITNLAGSPESNSSLWTKRTLYDGLREATNKNTSDDTLVTRAAQFLDLFDRLHRLKNRLPLRDLVEIWIEETGLESYWANTENGSLVRSNVHKFLRLCDAYAGYSSTKLSEIFEEIRIRDLQEGSAADPHCEGGAVQIMTVHAAKGLEAPIVALFDMNYSPRSTEDTFTHSWETGAAFCLNGHSPQEKYKPTLFEKIQQAKRDRDSAENERVLYVAMTRTQEKLILSASCTVNQESVKKTEGWFGTLIEHFNLDKDALFLPDSDASGFVPLIDKGGIATGLRLGRAWQMVPLIEDIPPRLETAGAIIEGIPDGFPAPSEPGLGPVSVVELLHEQVDVTTDCRISEEGEVISDEIVPADGFALGQWIHRLLQILPVDSNERQWREAAEEEALRLFAKAPEERVLTEVIRLLKNFYSSPMFQEIKGAQRVFREFPFIFELKGHLLKGKLDLAFEDKGDWTLVDYKSDRSDTAIDEKKQSHYRDQLLIYSVGWKKLTGKLPRRALLFYLDSGKTVDISLDKGNLERIIHLLETNRNRSNPL